MKPNKELVLSAISFLVAYIMTAIPAFQPYEAELVSGFSVIGFILAGVGAFDVRKALQMLVIGGTDKVIDGLDIDIVEELEDLIENNAVIINGKVEISEEDFKDLISGLVLEVAYDVLETFGYEIREREMGA